MPSLNLSERKYSKIKLADGKEYEIPNEYTVVEVERLLELREEQEAIENEEVTDKEKQLSRFWDIVFDQLTVLFRNRQPDITTEYLKSVVTQNEALGMIGFFQKYRHSALKEINAEKTQSEDTESKKKSRLAKFELRDLRRMIAFMVVNGFSLSELRSLYIDELYRYYEQLFYNLEKRGEVEKGSYAKLINNNKGTQVESTVNEIRKQMMMGIANKQK